MRAVLALAFVAAVVPAVAVEYRVYDLGPPGPFHHSEAFAVNDEGVVTLKQATNLDIPYVWSFEQGFVRMGPHTNFRTGADPLAINNSGMVTGELTRFGGGTRAFRWTRTRGYERLPVLPGLGAGRGAAINELGEVAGTCRKADVPDRAFFWSPAAGLVDIGVFHVNGASRAYGMNDAGIVVGQATFETSQGIRGRAYGWSRATGMVDLGLPPGIETTTASAINESNVVVGSCYDFNFNVYPFRWTSANGPERLPFFGNARDINEAGAIVGGNANGPFYYSDSGGLVYLNQNLEPESQEWQLDFASGLNNLGWIVGRGQLGGKTRAFLAVPN